MLVLMYFAFVFAVLLYREGVARRLRLIREINEPRVIEPELPNPRDAWPVFAGYRIEPSPQGPDVWPSNILYYLYMQEYQTAMWVASYIGHTYRGDYIFSVSRGEFGFSIKRNGRFYTNHEVKILKDSVKIYRGYDNYWITINISKIRSYSDIDVIMGFSFDYRPRRFISLPLHLQ